MRLIDGHLYVTEAYALARMQGERHAGLLVGFLFGSVLGIIVGRCF